MGDAAPEAKRRRGDAGRAAASDEGALAATLLAAAAASGEGDAAEAEAEAGEEEEEAEPLEEYFRTYGELTVHLLMLGDAPRVGAYVAALRAHRDSLKGKVVLDVGAGSGILSMAAARHGGARRVYAVEATAGAAKLARELIRRNGLQDVVQVVEGLVEAIELPEQVDAVVSEWMGHYLVHESMLDSVLVARERWLRPGGLMLPRTARIWAALVEAEELRREVEGFNDFHGLDLSPMGAARLEQQCREPQVELVSPERLLTPARLAWDLGDLAQLRPEATAQHEVELAFVAARAGHVAGLALWFDVGFGGELASSAADVALPTGPGDPSTHWKQTVVYLGAFVQVAAGDSLPLRLQLRQSETNKRQYDITVETA